MVKLFLPLKVRKDEQVVDFKSLKLNSQFGHTPVFLLYNTEDNTFKLIHNENHHFNGDIPPWKKATSHGAEIAIVPQLGSNPYSGLSNHGIEILKAEKTDTVDIVLEKYMRNELEALPKPEDGTSCSGKKKDHNHHHHEKLI